MLIFISLLYLISSLYIDFTWDGQAYHQEMTMRMVEGWNPFYSKQGGTWVYHYPKAFETIGVFFYTIFGSIKAVKLTNIFIFIILGLYAFNYFSKKYKKRESLVYSMMVAFNPILLCQLTSNLVDGFLYGTAAILILSYLLAKKDKSYMFDFFISLIILINIKYTGLVFAVAIVGYILFNELFIDKNKSKLIKNIIVLGLLASPFLYTPYLKNNLYENGHIFHPLMGENKEDFIEDYVPKLIEPYNRIERIALANFISVSNNIEAEFKIPFSFSIKELQRFRNASPRGGILGVWWSAILLISCMYYFISIWRYRNQFKFSHYEFIVLYILFFTLINEAGWWFRYTPFIWLIPLLLVLSIQRFSSKKLFEFGFFLIVFINGLLTLSISLGAIYLDTKRFEKRLAKYQNGKTHLIDFGNFYGNKTLFKEYNIKYTEAEKSSFQKPYSISTISGEVFFEDGTE